jgi:cation transport regulator ChaB/phage head maturation protease
MDRHESFTCIKLKYHELQEISMPYKNIDDLPKQLESLPNAAKKIFLATFNSAFDQYNDEEKAFAVAWGSVKKKYKKEGESWVEKSIGEINDFEMFCDFQKMDEEKRMVYGYATNDMLDSQGEITELEATAKAVEDYSKWRNIRVMHKPDPVGTAPIIEMRKAGLWIGAEIIDDDAWNKVKKGVYKGFSIGGRKIKVAQEFSESLKKNITRIKEYLLTEISLVDRPANPSATFSFIKREVNEMVDSVVPVEEPIAKEVTEPTPTETPAPVIEKAVEAPVAEVKVEEVKAEAVAKSEEPVEEQVTMTKAEYEALKNQADLAKKQDEVLDLLKARVEKAFASEEPKELVQREEKVVPKSIGELSLVKGGWLSKE